MDEVVMVYDVHFVCTGICSCGHFMLQCPWISFPNMHHSDADVFISLAPIQPRWLPIKVVYFLLCYVLCPNNTTLVPGAPPASPTPVPNLAPRLPRIHHVDKAARSRRLVERFAGDRAPVFIQKSPCGEAGGIPHHVSASSERCCWPGVA